MNIAGILGISFLVSIPGKFYFPSLEPELAQPKQGNGKQKSSVFTQNPTSNDLVKYSFKLFAYKYRIQVVVSSLSAPEETNMASRTACAFSAMNSRGLLFS